MTELAMLAHPLAARLAMEPLPLQPLLRHQLQQLIRMLT
jgi:hypothetical protein